MWLRHFVIQGRLGLHSRPLKAKSAAQIQRNAVASKSSRVMALTAKRTAVRRKVAALVGGFGMPDILASLAAVSFSLVRLLVVQLQHLAQDQPGLDVGS